MPKRNILHLIPSVGPESFGPGYVALNLAKEQLARGACSQVWCLDIPEDIRWAIETSGLPQESIRSFPSAGPDFLGYSPAMERFAAGSGGQKFSIVHQHGIWTGISRVANILRRKHRISTIVAPHGSLESWALRRSRWKKKIVGAIYESKNLDQAACLHATSEREVTDFRNFGLSNPIAVIENGISIEWLNSTGEAKRFRDYFHLSPEKRILLFMARITPKKGLLMLLDAINILGKDFDDWQLVIVGPDEFGHKSTVEGFVNKMNIQHKVRFIEPVFNQTKRDAFSASELFVLPSYSEGAPMVILDSLAAGVPAIVTKASPWGELSAHECGWWVDISVRGIHEALGHAVKMQSAELREMGQRGRILIASKYTWPVLAAKTMELYSWLLEQGDAPEFVYLNKDADPAKKRPRITQ